MISSTFQDIVDHRGCFVGGRVRHGARWSCATHLCPRLQEAATLGSESTRHQRPLEIVAFSQDVSCLTVFVAEGDRQH